MWDFMSLIREYIRRQAKYRGLTTCLIREASRSTTKIDLLTFLRIEGRTQIESGSRTVLGIGPGWWQRKFFHPFRLSQSFSSVTFGEWYYSKFEIILDAEFICSHGSLRFLFCILKSFLLLFFYWSTWFTINIVQGLLMFSFVNKSTSDKLFKTVVCDQTFSDRRKEKENIVLLFQMGDTTSLSDNLQRFGKYVKLNVGNHLFLTSLDTLTSQDTMFKGMFSGRLEVVQDNEGRSIDFQSDRLVEHFPRLGSDWSRWQTFQFDLELSERWNDPFTWLYSGIEWITERSQVLLYSTFGWSDRTTIEEQIEEECHRYGILL